MTIEDLVRYLGRQFVHKNYLRMLNPRRYTYELKKAFENVDAVICTTEDQKKRIQKYNKNVHIILDSVDDDALSLKPNRYNKSKTLNILWEGLASNIINFDEIFISFYLGETFFLLFLVLSSILLYLFIISFYKPFSYTEIKKVFNK